MKICRCRVKKGVGRTAKDDWKKAIPAEWRKSIVVLLYWVGEKISSYFNAKIKQVFFNENKLF